MNTRLPILEMLRLKFLKMSVKTYTHPHVYPPFKKKNNKFKQSFSKSKQSTYISQKEVNFSSLYIV